MTRPPKPLFCWKRAFVNKSTCACFLWCFFLLSRPRPRSLSPLRVDGVPVSFGLGRRLRRGLRRALEACEAPPRPGRPREAQARGLAQRPTPTRPAAAPKQVPDAPAAAAPKRAVSLHAVAASLYRGTDAAAATRAPPRRRRDPHKKEDAAPKPSARGTRASCPSPSSRCLTGRGPRATAESRVPEFSSWYQSPSS